MKTAFITGATSGIGEATARVFANNQINLVICGRRKDRLDALQQELSAKVKVHILVFDVRDRKAVETAIQSLPVGFQQIDILINNAGNAHGMSAIQDGSIDDWEAMIDTNVKGLLYVSQQIMSQMVMAQKGHIINIGSIAGKEVYPNGNIYCASKFAVDAISQSMRLDLNKFGIKVGAINPGLVETEFSLVRFKGDDKRAQLVYTGFDPLTAFDIAECILFMVTRPAHVNVADMLVLATAQANTTIVNRNAQQGNKN